MGKCRKIRLLFVEAADEALDLRSRRRLERHLETCGACASEFAGLQETIRLMKMRTRPDPGRDFWEGYGGRLAAKLDAAPVDALRAATRRHRISLPGIFGRIPLWSYAAAAGLIILFVGIRVGQRLGPGGETAGPSGAARLESISANPVLAGQIKDYFSRSKIILLALANFDSAAEDPYALNLSYQQQVSRELLVRGRELESRLIGAEGRRYRNLIGDLKTVLAQIANLDAGDNVQAVEIVRNGVHLRGILFKISISEMSLSEGIPSRKDPAFGRISNP
ncbi:MAG: zf-HC2 domain-containing protein [Candidatus Aminicenantales bacterium]